MDERVFWTYMGAYGLALVIIGVACLALQPSRGLTFNERWSAVPGYVSIRHLP